MTDKLLTNITGAPVAEDNTSITTWAPCAKNTNRRHTFTRETSTF
jgi:hypothetical protein